MPLHPNFNKQLNFQYEDSPHQQNKLQILIPNDIRRRRINSNL